MKLSSPIYTLKRQAKLLAREHGVKLHEALNQIASKEGFNDWSHLAYSYSKASPARDIINQLTGGDMVLVGARPGHGKTLLGLECVARADQINRKGHFFTLDETEASVWTQFERLGFDPTRLGRTVVVDTSDNICADYIIDCLGRSPDDALIVVDYLQLMDQRRSHPPLEEQVLALKAFAAEHDAIVVMISQIDRAFERSSNEMPGLQDVRLPNPIDLTLFDKLCFLHDGDIQLEKVA